MFKCIAGGSRFASCAGLALILCAVTAGSGTPAHAGATQDPLGGDPLIGSFFQLDAGEVSAYFTEIDGIGSETEVVEHKILDKTGGTIVRKIPGRLKFLDVTLKRGITTNQDLWTWRALVEDGKFTDAQKSATITMYDQTMKTVAVWELDYAWPSRIVAPGLPSATGAPVEELTLVNEGYRRIQ